jgi:hypothetical protein
MFFVCSNSLQPEEVLPPAEYPAAPPSVLDVHPAVMGYERGDTGDLIWDPSQTSAVCVGEVWERSRPWVCLDSRVLHPSSFTYHEDLSPAKKVDVATLDFAMTSPMFAGVGLTKCVRAEVVLLRTLVLSCCRPVPLFRSLLLSQSSLPRFFFERAPGHILI